MEDMVTIVLAGGGGGFPRSCLLMVAPASSCSWNQDEVARQGREDLVSWVSGESCACMWQLKCKDGLREELG